MRNNEVSNEVGRPPDYSEHNADDPRRKQSYVEQRPCTHKFLRRHFDRSIERVFQLIPYCCYEMRTHLQMLFFNIVSFCESLSLSE